MNNCARCKDAFTPLPAANGLAGFMDRMLSGFCPKCRIDIQAETRKSQEAEIEERKKKADEERRQRLILKRKQAVGEGEPYDDWTFQAYHPEWNKTHLWFNFMKAFPIDAKNLLVYGPTGVGKSHLCTAKIKTLWEKSPPGVIRRITAKELRNAIRYSAAHQANNEYEREFALRELALKTDAVFLDELDKVLEIKDPRALAETIGYVRELVTLRAEAKRFGLIFAANVDQENISAIFGLPVGDRMNSKTWEIFEIPPDTQSVRGMER